MDEGELQQCYFFILDLIKNAGSVFKDGFKKTKNIECKSSPKDLVTETDINIEKLLMDNLKKRFPDHSFIGEESASAGIKSHLSDNPTWIIDPVDGTMNFAHTFPYTCISVGLWVKKRAEIGIVYNPVLGHLFTACRSKGAYLNGDKLQVSGQNDLSKSLIVVEMGTRNNEEKADIMFSNLRKLVREAHGIRTIGSAALNMCHVAMGAADAYYEIGIHAWDMAAGALIVREAGGYVCDVNGEDFNVLSRRILCASSKELSEQILKMIDIYEEEWD